MRGLYSRFVAINEPGMPASPQRCEEVARDSLDAMRRGEKGGYNSHGYRSACGCGYTATVYFLFLPSPPSPSSSPFRTFS